MSAKKGSSVPDGLLHAYIGRLKPSTPSIGQPSTVDPRHGMELASRLSPGPCSVYRQLQIGSENSSFRNTVGTISALEALRDALYKSTTGTTTTTTTTSK